MALGQTYGTLACMPCMYSTVVLAIIVFLQGFEVDMYLRAIECDVLDKKCLGALKLTCNVLWPEVSLYEL
jgi:hypothetical protein